MRKIAREALELCCKEGKCVKVKKNGKEIEICPFFEFYTIYLRKVLKSKT